MKLWNVLVLTLAAVAGAGAQPLTLVSGLADRPVFSYLVGGVTETRALAPGSRVRLEAGLFSGLGEKKLPLMAGATYYLAQFGSGPGLWRLGADQVLIVNASGRAVPLTLSGDRGAAAVLASGSFALGGPGADGAVTATWDPGTGPQTLTLAGGRVYRLALASPDGVGVTVDLSPWD